MATLLGKKLGMTQVWSESGDLIPVTVIEAGPCVVTQVKTVQTDGYNAIQVGFSTLKEGKANKPAQGHFDKAKTDAMRHLAEIRLDKPGCEPEKEFDSGYALGDSITVEEFSEIKHVNISGVSKGKGFAGVMKRYNFGGGRATHGSHFHRAPGSVGQASTPSRVFKGQKMPGRMGTDKVTVRNLEVVEIIADQNLLLVKGAVPGGKNALLTIKGQGE